MICRQEFRQEFRGQKVEFIGTDLHIANVTFFPPNSIVIMFFSPQLSENNRAYSFESLEIKILLTAKHLKNTMIAEVFYSFMYN